MRPVIIAGPTASGKSELALRIAERDGGCVVNADALQVYGCWRVLTARPDEADTARAPHALYGHVAGDGRYSVGAWLRDFETVLDDLHARGQRPVIAGGSGLYLSALTEGLADIPEVPACVRADSQELLSSGRIEVMHADLERGDAVTWGGIDRNNPMRVQRAWEVLRATGRGLSEWQRMKPPPVLRKEACDLFVLNAEKTLLNNVIEKRFRKMVEGGALTESAAYRAAGYDPALPSAQVLGHAELVAHLDGLITMDEAVTRASVATRRFAKRQRSWFRSRMSDWTWVDPTSADPLQMVR